MSTWRYSISREKHEGQDVYAIREVHIADDGALSWTQDPVPIVGDSWLEVADSVSLMAGCIGDPVLDLTLDPPAFVARRDL